MKSNIRKNYKFSFLYAIGSILIVAGHCNNGGVNIAYDFFNPYSFHIALFVFSSGYFYKQSNEENVVDYLWKKFKRLIVPMYILNILCGIIIYFLHKCGFTFGADFTIYNLLVAPLNNGHQFFFNTCFWFVVPLFLTETVNILLRKLLKKLIKSEYTYTIISLMLGIIGLTLARYGYAKGDKLVLFRLLYFLPHYEIGILYNRKLEKKDNLNNWIYFAIIICIQLIIFTFHGGVPLYNPTWLKFKNQIFTPYIESILGILFWLRISKILEQITQKSKIINLIADNSYYIMAYQFFGFFFVKTIFAAIGKYTKYFSDFNFKIWKIDPYYYYLPKGIYQWLILYLIAGIVLPLFISKIVEKLKNINYKKTNTVKESLTDNV